MSIVDANTCWLANRRRASVTSWLRKSSGARLLDGPPFAAAPVVNRGPRRSGRRRGAMAPRVGAHANEQRPEPWTRMQTVRQLHRVQDFTVSP